MRINSKSVLLAAVLTSVVSVSITAQELEYDVYYDGDKIGSTVVTSRVVVVKGVEALEVVSRTDLRVKSWGRTVYSFESEQIEVHGSDGLLEHGSARRVDGNETIVLGSRRVNELRFEIVADGDTVVFAPPLSSFDFTSSDGPELSGFVRGVEATYRVLDLERLKVIERAYTWVEDTQCEVGDRAIPCRVVAVRDANGEAHRWIARDQEGTLLREAGRDDDGVYRIELTSYTAGRL